MIRNHLSDIDGIGIFPEIVLILFVSLFVVIVYSIIKMDKKQTAEYGNLPFDDEQESENKTEKLR